jgi:hypothetical protein
MKLEEIKRQKAIEGLQQDLNPSDDFIKQAPPTDSPIRSLGPDIEVDPETEIRREPASSISKSFINEKMIGLDERDKYRKALSNRLTKESIDSITQGSVPGFPLNSDLLIMKPMYESLNNKDISGDINSQIGIMKSYSPIKTDQSKEDQFKLQMMLEDLKKNQQLT